MTVLTWVIVLVIAIVAGGLGGAAIMWFLVRRGVVAGASAAAAQIADVLRNGGMEAPFLQHDNTTIVASDWAPFFSSGDSEIGSEECGKPEFKALTRAVAPYRVLEGDSSQCWFIRWRLFDGGIYQECQIPAGAVVRFSASVHAWCSQLDDPMADDGELYFNLGLDLSGGINAYGPGVVWGGWVRATRDWQKLEIAAVSTGPWVTVFIRAANKWRLSHNDAYVDGARLEVEGGGDVGRYVDRDWLGDRYQALADDLRGPA